MYEVVFVNPYRQIIQRLKQPQELPTSVILIPIASHYLFGYLYPIEV
jgi:hypothetical protein